MSEYVRLSSGRLVYAGLVELFEYVESLGCMISIDSDGEVCVTNRERLSLDIEFELQSSCRSVDYWLRARAQH
jgi:hypothetical protein